MTSGAATSADANCATTLIAPAAMRLHFATRMMTPGFRSWFFVLVAAAGCADNNIGPEDGRDDVFTSDGKLDGFQCTAAEAAAILHVVNTATKAELKNDVELSAKAADNIIAYRTGDDETVGTSDDETFGSLAELDAIPFVGPIAFQKLLAYVHDSDLVGDVPATGWHVQTIATGDQADFALTPEGQPVMVLRDPATTTYKLRLVDGTQVDVPADVAMHWTDPPQVAVDRFGTPHIFYPVGESIPTTTYRHAAYRNGQWVQHQQLDVDAAIVDQGPQGQIFVFAGKKYPSLSDPTSSIHLFTVEANGSHAGGPQYWDTEFTRPYLGFNVGIDGVPAIAYRGSSWVTYSRPGGNRWDTSTVTTLSANGVTTTGGPDAVVVVSGSNVSLHRQTSTSFQRSSILDLGPATSLDATRDALATSHVCYVHGGIAVHVSVDVAGNEYRTELGSADQCWIGTDALGKVHVQLRAGSTIKHATQP